MYKLIAFMLLIFASQHARAQFEKNYTPVSFTGMIPQSILQSAEEKTRQDVNKAGDELTKKQSREFFTEANFALKNVLLSGSVFFNDELSLYVNRVTDKLLRNSPEIKSQVRVYVTRFAVVNASSWRDGSIFINLGLIRRMKTEAQLAFVISHEICHYLHKHNLLQFKRERDYQRGGLANFGRSSDTENMFARLSYSRSHEYEADSAGFQLFAAAGYDLSEATEALRLLQTSDSDKYARPVDLSKYFETEKIKLDSSYVCKPKNEKKKKKSSVQVIIIREQDSDTLSTHPDIEKRIAAIDSIRIGMDSTDRKNLAQHGELFNRVAAIADFEIAEKHFQDTDYGRSLYEAFMLLEKYPDNEYLATLVARNLYWITYYKLIKSEKSVLDINIRTSNFYYDQLNCYLNLLPQDKMNKLTRGYLTKLLKQYPDSEELYITEARLIELTESIGNAKKLYQAYLARFPQGVHAAFATVKTKIK